MLSSALSGMEKNFAAGPQRGMERPCYPKTPHLGSRAPLWGVAFPEIRHLLK
jgi:hypothetical protein